MAASSPAQTDYADDPAEGVTSEPRGRFAAVLSPRGRGWVVGAATGRRSWLWLSALIGVVWAVVAGCFLAHATVLLPVLVLVATASLVRGGRTLLDRLMIAMALLLGAVCAAGLLFSLWPWGLHPVPVFGTTATVLVVAAGVLRRRPTLPRPRLGDLAPVGVSFVVAAMAMRPLIRLGQSGRVAIAAVAEDAARHLTVFDGIRRSGSYLFLEALPGGLFSRFLDSATIDHTTAAEMRMYPQGAHLLAALVDRIFWPNPQGFGDGLQMLDRYLVYSVVAYAVLVLTVVWCTQWIAASSMTTGRRLALAAFAAAFLFAGDLLRMLALGYFAEIIALTEMTLLVALLARPLARTRQQLVIMASLVVALGFTYYLFLPVAAVLVVVWGVRHRTRVLRHRTTVLVLIVVAAPLALLQGAVGTLVGKQAHDLNSSGEPFRRDLVIALACFVLAGLLTRRALAVQSWRGYLWCLLPTLAIVGGFVAKQHLVDHLDRGYYAYKYVELLLCLLIPGVGVIARHLPEPRPERWRHLPMAARVRVVAALLPGVLVAGGLTAGFGLGYGDSPMQTFHNTTWGRTVYRGSLRYPNVAARVMQEYRRYPGGDGVATGVFLEDPRQMYLTNLFLPALQHASGEWRLVYPSPEQPSLDEAIEAVDRRTRIIVDSDRTEKLVKAACDRHRDRDITVVRAAGLRS